MKEKKVKNENKDIIESQESTLLEKVVYVNRVSKTVKGGKRFGFAALVVIGDQKGQIGVGYGKAKEVPEAIKKGIGLAKKNLMTIPLKNSTILYLVKASHLASHVVLKPAAPGTGIIAGGPVRAVMDALGVKDILTKSLGSNNPINVVTATINGLIMMKQLKEREELRQTLA